MASVLNTLKWEFSLLANSFVCFLWQLQDSFDVPSSFFGARSVPLTSWFDEMRVSPISLIGFEGIQFQRCVILAIFNPLLWLCSADQGPPLKWTVCLITMMRVWPSGSLHIYPTMPPMQKSHLSRIPFYFTARHRNVAPPWSFSQELEAQQETDLCAEDLKLVELHKLNRDLELYNAMGRLVTFDKVIKDWVTWNR